MSHHEFSFLARRLRAEEDALERPGELERARQGFLSHVDEVLEKRASRRWKGVDFWAALQRPWALSSVVVGAVALSGAGWLAWSSERVLGMSVDGRGAVDAGAWLAAPADEPLAVQFSDGSRFELAPTARGRVLEVDSQGSHVMLERGQASVSIVKRPKARWRFSAGPFVVDVLGTGFELEWDPEQDHFALHLTEGEVSVSGCSFGKGRSVLRGETVRASCRSQRFEVTARGKAAEAEAPAQAAPEDAEVQAPAATSLKRAEPSPEVKETTWRIAAREARYADALALAEAQGFESILARASAGDLALLADAARLTRHSDRALSAYQALRKRHPGTKAASTAAFHLARIHFDQLGAYSRAASWFETYLKEQPQGDLAREAHGRWLESLKRSGNEAGARRAAERYLAKYPEGPHAPLARHVLGL